MPRLLTHAASGPRAVAGAATVLAAAVLAAGGGPAAGRAVTAHDDEALPRGCGSCHVGHGRRRSQMLPALEENLCFRCHGGAGKRAEMRRLGLLRTNAELRDVSHDFKRPFRHPIEQRGLHRPGEQLPERDQRTERHAECVDCHRSHRTVPAQALPERGGAPRRSTLDGRSPEYELCYRCHSTSVNLPRTSSNIQRLFAANNASYHPVETVGKGRYVPSLREPLTTRSMISCGDCHGNDSGKGIHGSRYAFLLRRNYSSGARTPESPFAYALCYDCHDRRVLYSGRGFVYHAKHVQEKQVPCADCHNPHGSRTLSHLIEFSSRDATPSTSTGRLGYLSFGAGRGQCYVLCHGKDHPGTEYCEAGPRCGSSPTRDRLQPLRQQLRGSPFSF